MKKAIILSSGGLDSTTAIAVAKKDGFECYSLSFDYGQRHRAELNAAISVAEIMNVKRKRPYIHVLANLIPTH